MQEHTNLLWENEVNANRVLSFALLVTSAIIAGILALLELDVFYVGEVNFRPFVLAIIVLMLVSVLVARRVRFEKQWVKYLLVFALLVACVVCDAIFTYSAYFMMIIPTVISSRYFSRRFTFLVALVSLIAFFFSAVYGATHGVLDLNNLELPRNTVVNLGDYTWLGDAVEGIPYDRALMVKNVILYSFSVRFLLSLIVTSFCARIAGQGRTMLFRQQKLTETTTRMNVELETAAHIQTGVLPDQFPAFPERTEFDIFATMEPAKEVGGDFYDFFMIDEDHLALVVADVSGKGVPAALFMMTSRSVLKSLALSKRSPREVLADANDVLAKENKESLFVTVWFGVLELSTGRLTFADGGHEKPLLYQNNTWEIKEKAHPGVALGMFSREELASFPGEAFANEEILLRPGDAIFQYSDGVTEAADSAGELFRESRLLEAARSAPSADPNDFLPHIRRKIGDYTGEAPQSDDITMLGLIYKGT